MSDIRQHAQRCRDASRQMAQLSTAAKNALLLAMADAVEADTGAIITANSKDMAAAAEKGIAGAMLDRLMLDAARVRDIASALRAVAALPDPVGQTTRREVRPNGIVVERVRVPLGVIAMIYEARPNVTADAATGARCAGPR